jgi:hypothetical protein
MPLTSRAESRETGAKRKTPSLIKRRCFSAPAGASRQKMSGPQREHTTKKSLRIAKALLSVIPLGLEPNTRNPHKLPGTAVKRPHLPPIQPPLYAICGK